MNANISHLYEIAQKPTRRIIGLMSGTSLDGLDVALCQINGHGKNTQVQLLKFETVVFSEEIKNEIRQIFARKNIDFQHLTLLNAWIGQLHGNAVLTCLNKWNILPESIDAVASHGQTVFHAPKILHGLAQFPDATLQIGDGDHVAVTTGILTLSDFRQKHVAAGGEGAPLAVYGDYFIFSNPTQNRVMLNMGGIANFTYLPSSLDANAVFVTDTGPGNTLIDAFARLLFGLPYDDEGRIAASGTVHEPLLEALKNNSFFDAPFPKTTGPELFGVAYVQQAQARTNANDLAPNDLMTTLTKFSADTVVAALQKSLSDDQSYHIYTSGGGMHNPILVGYLQQALPRFVFAKTDELGIAGDAKEAVLFAILANEALAGGNTNFGTRRGVPSVSLGKISFPN